MAGVTAAGRSGVSCQLVWIGSAKSLGEGILIAAGGLGIPLPVPKSACFEVVEFTAAQTPDRRSMASFSLPTGCSETTEFLCLSRQAPLIPAVLSASGVLQTALAIITASLAPGAPLRRPEGQQQSDPHLWLAWCRLPRQASWFTSPAMASRWRCWCPNRPIRHCSSIMPTSADGPPSHLGKVLPRRVTPTVGPCPLEPQERWRSRPAAAGRAGAGAAPGRARVRALFGCDGVLAAGVHRLAGATASC